MATITPASLFGGVVCVCFLVSAAAVQINATVGENVTVPFRAPNINAIRAVELTRPDLGTEHVLLYRDGHFEPENQHPSFKNRVDLQDRQMKDGNVSLILKNVTVNDTGTYECHVFMEGANNESIINITLRVVAPPGPTGGLTEDGGKEDGSVGLKVGVPVAAAVVVVGVVAVVAGCVIYRRRRQNQVSYQPPVELQPV